MNSPDPGFPVETLALPHEDAAGVRRVFDEWGAAYRPGSPIERGLMLQAAAASIEFRRSLHIRVTLLAENVRRAELEFEHDQEDTIRKYVKMFDVDPGDAMVGLKRSAAGCRYAIARWERLEALLADDGTWYGSDRIEAIHLQGHSAVVQDLYFSETAYRTWLYCLAAQPDPKQPDIDLICHETVVPKALQDKYGTLWRPDPNESRAQLQKTVARELAFLRDREEWLRVQFVEPARAAAREKAMARVSSENPQLLRDLSTHQRSFQQAVRTFQNLRIQIARSPSRVDAIPDIPPRELRTPNRDGILAETRDRPARLPRACHVGD
jgi:hypothetical protein